MYSERSRPRQAVDTMWYVVMPFNDVTTPEDAQMGFRVWLSLFVDGRGHGRDRAGDVVVNYWPGSWTLLQDRP